METSKKICPFENASRRRIRVSYIGIYGKFSSKLFINREGAIRQKRITPSLNDTLNKSIVYHYISGISGSVLYL